MLSPSSWLLLYDSRYKGSQECTRLSPIDGQQVLLWKLEMSAETVSRFVEIFRNHLQNIWQISNIATEWVTDTCQTAVVWTVFELLDYFFCLPWDVSKGFNTLEKWLCEGKMVRHLGHSNVFTIYTPFDPKGSIRELKQIYRGNSWCWYPRRLCRSGPAFAWTGRLSIFSSSSSLNAFHGFIFCFIFIIEESSLTGFCDATSMASWRWWGDLLQNYGSKVQSYCECTWRLPFSSNSHMTCKRVSKSYYFLL